MLMTTQVMVNLPDEVYQSAVRLAQLTQREVSDVLTDTLAVSLPALPHDQDISAPVEVLSDGEVLALTALELPPPQDRQLSTLLERQQAGTLAEDERSQLAALMQAYQTGLLRKAQALQEAVRRGLRDPLAP
jgi:hypothetical protein